MNNIDTAFLIVLIASNIITFYWAKKKYIEHTLDYLERTGMIEFEEE